MAIVMEVILRLDMALEMRELFVDEHTLREDLLMMLPSLETVVGELDGVEVLDAAPWPHGSFPWSPTSIPIHPNFLQFGLF